MAIYSCEICDKNFVNAGALASHIKFHDRQNKKEIIITEFYCNICDKYFKNAGGFASHNKKHNQNYEKETIITDKTIITNCEYCGNYIYNSNKRFCNQSCSMKHFNIKPKTDEIKTKIINTLKNTVKPAIQHNNRKFKYVEGDFTKVYFRTCRCKILFCTPNLFQRTCNDCIEQHGDGGREVRKSKAPYQFKFKVENYPDLFDLDLIAKIGWYIPKINPKGLSRDHRVSITDALVNGYDPYYISHPMNCSIITQKENVIKRTSSAITYEDLVEFVKNYDQSK